MGDPVIVERAAHSLSRSQIDPDALKVLYRLHQNSLRRVSRRRERSRPAARPAPEGLRHRHVGPSLPGQAAVQELLGHRPPIPARSRPVRHEDHRGRDLPAQGDRRRTCRRGGVGGRAARSARGWQPGSDRLIHRENTFGTPEEDAFRRDFTINALFYDIGTFAIIDYTGGLEDLRAGWCARSVTRRSAFTRIPSGCFARSRWPRGSGSLSTRRSMPPSPAAAQRSPAARRRD